MKKSLFMLAVAAAALSSCVKSQVVEVADNMAIGFDTYVGKHTRSTTVVINGRSDLKTFYVFGNAKAADESTEEVFDLQKVYWSGTNAQDGHYEYNNGVSTMWKTNKTYYFAAVSNGNAILDEGDTGYDSNYDVNVAYTYAGGAGDANKLTITNYTVNDKDLIVDIADPIVSLESMTGKETVTFDFRHLLTRVRFVVNNGDALGSNSIVAVEDLKFTGTKTADCDYTWTNSNTHNISWTDPTPAPAPGEYNYTPQTVDPSTNNGQAYIITPSSNKSFGKFVIPQSNQNVQVSFSLVTYKEETDGSYTETNRVNHTYPLTYDNDTNPSDANYDYTWHAGKVYQYTVTVAGTINYIRFDANVAAWNFDLDGNGTANTDDDIIMNN